MIAVERLWYSPRKHVHSKKMPLFSLARSATLAGILILIGLLPSTSWAAEPIAAILYPDLREPYREVITSIIDGIKSELLGAEAYAVNDGFDHEALKKTLRANNVGVLVGFDVVGLKFWLRAIFVGGLFGLGWGGLFAAEVVGLVLRVVVGALLI